MIDLVGENNISLPVMWKSKKQCRAAKSLTAGETLIQVEAVEACLWPSNLLNEILYCKPSDGKR